MDNKLLRKTHYPQITITGEEHSNSPKRGKDIELSSQLEPLGQELQGKLEPACQRRSLQT